jgi:hypothetical protein
MARPPKIDTIQFRRKLDNPKRQILLTVGQGNISQGFENLLALYQYLHSLGYRIDEPFDRLGLVTNCPRTNEQPLEEESLVR